MRCPACSKRASSAAGRRSCRPAPKSGATCSTRICGRFATIPSSAHATDREAHSADQPVLLTTAAGNANARRHPLHRRRRRAAGPRRLQAGGVPVRRPRPGAGRGGARAVEAAEGRPATRSPTGSRRPSGAGSARREAGLHRAGVPGRAGPGRRLSHAGDEPAAYADRHLAGLCAGERIPRLRRQAQCRTMRRCRSMST